MSCADDRSVRPLARHQRGAALMVTLILVTALLGGGALAVYLQLADTRAAQYVTESRRALFCAEAGLAGARPYLLANTGGWSVMLDADPSNDPDGYPITGDIDGDGTDDYSVTIKDNEDEAAPAANNPAADIDATIFAVSSCTRYPDTPRTVLELLSFSGGGHNYRNQSGQGAGGSNNAN